MDDKMTHIIELILLTIIAFSKVIEKLIEKVKPLVTTSKDDVHDQIRDVHRSFARLITSLENTYMRKDVAAQQFANLNQQIEDMRRQK